MIPILFKSTETAFTTQGLGTLTDAISCTVTEERNGMYELELTYPQTGIHFGDIQNGNIILSIPSPYRSEQPFRIYKVTKPLNGKVTVYANHISYDLNKIPVNPFAASSAAAAMAGLKDAMTITNKFSFWTDKTTSADFSLEVPTACRSCLGGQDGSILDVYGGEYEWDRFSVKLYNQRGNDSGVVIRYGKNLTGLTQEGDISSLVGGIYPYWHSDGVLVTCDPPIIYADGATAQSAVPVDLTTKFQEQPTVAQLKAAAESYIKSNGIGNSTVSLTVEFIQLARMSGFEGLALLEKCDLCDTVTVQYTDAGIDVEAEIVSIQTDVLLERYDKMEVGSIRANIAQTIADQQAQIAQNRQENTTFLQQAVENATKWITGGRGGYVIFQLNANGQPDEILIMDTPSIETATKVWRWNRNGLGFSNNGYEGPYETAITQDGAIVADFITAGSLLANMIHGGTLTLGGANNGNGVLRIVNSSGQQIGKWDKDGITATTGTFAGNLSAAGGTFAGNLSAAGGTFAGNLSAAGGTFAGSLTAGSAIAGEVNVTSGGIVLPLSTAGAVWMRDAQGVAMPVVRAYDNANNPNVTINACGGGLYLGSINTPQGIYFEEGAFTESGAPVTSDERLKDDITCIDPKKSLEIINALIPKRYRYKKHPQYTHHGFVAQDVQRIFEDDWGIIRNHYPHPDEGKEYLALNYTELIADLVGATQALYAEVKELKKGMGRE